jgi:GrpB-like predicted nucleotidyltransferase (UPF0157 family)
MKTRILLGIGMLLAGSSMAIAQTAVPGYPDVKVLPVDTTQAAKHNSGEDIQHQLSANLTGAGYTDVKIMPEAFIVEAKNKSGEKVVMFLTPDSLTVFTAIDANGQDSRTVPTAPPPVASAK